MRIGIVGTGHIAAPIVRYLVTKGHEVAVTRRNEMVSSALKESHGVTVADPQTVVDSAEVVFLCVRPQHAQDALSALTFREDQQIVSVMAGVSSSELARLCAPATDVVQTIPLGYLERGGCPLAAYGNDALLARLFAPENLVIKVETEAALNAHFAICALVPGLLDLMATSAGWLAEKTGNKGNAEFYTTQILAGFLHAMQKDGAGRLEDERDALATPGSISLQMTQALRDGGAHDVLRHAQDAIGDRLSA